MDEKIDEFRKAGYRYVHYTSASVLISILQKKEVWLRHVTLMNDYQEIERGVLAVAKFFGPNGKKANAFWEVLDKCFPGISNEIKARYDFSRPDLRENTFVMSFSAHLDSEDSIGRLSMWRAYAPKDGVALILNPDVFYREENRLNVFSYPALYWTDDKIEERFAYTVELFVKNSAALSALEFGFAEELEMRIVYRSRYRPSKVTIKSIETIGTTPQIVHKIPLNAELNTDLVSILNSVILGPSRSIQEVSYAVLDAMEEAGIPNAENKIFLSDIPLRT